MGFLDLLERKIEGPRYRFLDQTLAQTDPEVAGQNLDQVLRFERGESAQARLKQLGFARWTAGFMEGFKQGIRFA